MAPTENSLVPSQINIKPHHKACLLQFLLSKTSCPTFSQKEKENEKKREEKRREEKKRRSHAKRQRKTQSEETNYASESDSDVTQMFEFS